MRSKTRIAWINDLARDALRTHERRDLVLDLRYAPEARERVREMVRNEQTCCSFLTFDLREEPHEIRLVITAPEAAREAADMLFQQFVAAAPAQSACACTVQSPDAKSGAVKQPGAKVAGLTAITLATGAVACGTCCVLPFALPAAALAGTGSILALFAAAHAWVTILAILAVVGAWGWIATLIVRTRCRPASSTLTLMLTATALTGVAVLWPFIEPHLLNAL
ncbi:MAG: hypothetical protein ACKVP3_09445 [Hyphomicrobiaceae bacterium]